MKMQLQNIKLAIYYVAISKLPNSQFISIFNRLRCFYLERVLKILEPDPRNKIQRNVYISNGKNVTIGRCCQINESVFIQGATIGSFVMIAPTFQ